MTRNFKKDETDGSRGPEGGFVVRIGETEIEDVEELRRNEGYLF